MFSENRRISGRQLQTLLLADWMGKIMLLQPGLTRNYSGAQVLIGTAAGLILAAVFLLLTMRTSWASPADCFTHVKKQKGIGAAVLLYLIYGIYFFEQAVFMLYLCGEIAGHYFLPEYSRIVLLLLPAVIGYFLAGGGLEIRGRVSEVLAWLLAILFFFFLAAALFQADPSRLLQAVKTGNHGPEGILACLGLTAAGFGSLFVIPLVLPETEQKKGWDRRMYLAFGMAGLLLLMVYLGGYGTLGGRGMERQLWPAIALMSCTDMAGVFFQRWDVIFTAFLLLSLFLAAGSGIYYAEKITVTLMGNREMEKRHAAVRGILLAAAVLLAWAMESPEQALYLYERISLWVCVPVMGVLILLIRRKRRGGMAGAALVLLTAAAVLTGCGAKELENRCFPLVLELDADEQGLLLGCAWPTVKEEEGKQSNENRDSQDQEDEEQKETEQASQTQSDEEQKGTEQDSQTQQEEKLREKRLVNEEKLTRVQGKNIQEAVEKMQGLQDRYVDYSQVQAILWGSGLEDHPEQRREVLRWLEEDPSFSGNILVFQGETRDLDLETIQEHAQGQPGDYLKKLYENNRQFRKRTRMLREVLYGAESSRSLQSGAEEALLQRGISRKVLRFHVLANSSSREDQAVKLEVREELLEWLENKLSRQEEEDLQLLKLQIKKLLPQIEEEAEKILIHRGFTYGVSAKLENTCFPKRTYGTCTFPAGTYQALRIQLGAARGRNWWCILFPKLCFLDCVHGVLPEDSQEQLRHVLTEEEYESLFDPNKDDYRIAFRFF